MKPGRPQRPCGRPADAGGACGHAVRLGAALRWCVEPVIARHWSALQDPGIWGRAGGAGALGAAVAVAPGAGGLQGGWLRRPSPVQLKVIPLEVCGLVERGH